MEMESRQIHMVEIRKHTSTESLWFVINNAVYDVTAFLEQHPGGADALLESAGQDATTAFEDVGHSDDAREEMKKFKIGILHPDDVICKPKDLKYPERQKRVRIVDPDPDPDSSFGCVKIAVAVLAAGLIIGFVLKKYVLA